MASARVTGLGRAAALVTVVAMVSAMPLAGGAGLAQAARQRAGTGMTRAGLAVSPGTISTIAGGVGGPARATQVSLHVDWIGPGQPCAPVDSGGTRLAVSYGAGQVYAADGASVRAVSQGTDQLTTPAGTGLIGPLGDGDPATGASLSTCGVTLDHARNLVIADSASNRIRVVPHTTGTFYGQAMTAGHIYTVAGNGKFGNSGNGGLAIHAAVGEPQTVMVDSAGNLLIGTNNRIRVVAAKTGTFYAQPMTAGHIYTVAGQDSTGFSGDGGPATQATLNVPQGLTVDSTGNLLIADSDNQRIRVIAAKTGTFYGQAMTASHIYTVAGDGTAGFSGDGGPATSAELNRPDGVAVDGAGNLLIADANNDRLRVVAAITGTFYGQAMTAGHIYTIAGNGGTGFSGDGGPATQAEVDPTSVAVDGAGSLVLTDTGNQRIRVIAAKTGTFYGQAMKKGDIYTVAGGGNSGLGDGGPATSAELNNPDGVGLDGAGNLVIADTQDNRIRVVPVTTGTFYGQTMTADDIYTVVGDGTQGFGGDGGPALAAELNGPAAVAVNAAGDLLICGGDNRIREVTAFSAAR